MLYFRSWISFGEKRNASAEIQSAACEQTVDRSGTKSGRKPLGDVPRKLSKPANDRNEQKPSAILGSASRFGRSQNGLCCRDLWANKRPGSDITRKPTESGPSTVELEYWRIHRTERDQNRSPIRPYESDHDRHRHWVAHRAKSDAKPDLPSDYESAYPDTLHPNQALGWGHGPCAEQGPGSEADADATSEFSPSSDCSSRNRR